MSCRFLASRQGQDDRTMWLVQCFGFLASRQGQDSAASTTDRQTFLAPWQGQDPAGIGVDE